MRVAIVLLLAFLVPASATGQTNEAVLRETTTLDKGTDYSPMPPMTPMTPMTPGGKINYYLKSSFGPASIFTSAFSSGFNQALDSVPEWGQGMEGYGKRFASSTGRKAVENTTRYGLKIMLREDPRYFYSDREGIRLRTLHAIGEVFVAHKDSGGTRPDYSYFAGLASGVYISRQWHPENRRNATDYIQDAAVSIGIQCAKNVFTEFWPDIRKKLLKR